MSHLGSDWGVPALPSHLSANSISRAEGHLVAGHFDEALCDVMATLRFSGGARIDPLTHRAVAVGVQALYEKLLPVAAAKFVTDIYGTSWEGVPPQTVFMYAKICASLGRSDVAQRDCLYLVASAPSSEEADSALEVLLFLVFSVPQDALRFVQQNKEALRSGRLSGNALNQCVAVLQQRAANTTSICTLEPKHQLSSTRAISSFSVLETLRTMVAALLLRLKSGVSTQPTVATIMVGVLVFLVALFVTRRQTKTTLRI